MLLLCQSCYCYQRSNREMSEDTASTISDWMTDTRRTPGHVKVSRKAFLPWLVPIVTRPMSRCDCCCCSVIGVGLFLCSLMDVLLSYFCIVVIAMPLLLLLLLIHCVIVRVHGCYCDYCAVVCVHCCYCLVNSVCFLFVVNYMNKDCCYYCCCWLQCKR